MNRKQQMRRTGFIQKARKPMRARSVERAKEEKAYNAAIKDFLEEYPICPVTGEQTTQVHHSAKREGGWLNLRRYWIAVSDAGHKWIEDNKKEAEQYGLMVRINEPFLEHCAKLTMFGEDLAFPCFYDKHEKLPLVDETTGKPLNAEPDKYNIWGAR